MAACGRDAPPKPALPSGAEAPAAPAPADSLVLQTPRGVEVWFTLRRDGRDSSGVACVERGLELRDRARRTAVPLLYTRDVPRLVSESTLSARLWTHCRPGPEYRVNLRTGQPVRVTP